MCDKGEKYASDLVVFSDLLSVVRTRVIVTEYDNE